MYTTGISAFSTVYVKLSIQITLVETQSLKIRIYSERKNYFYSNACIK
jgi:NADPH-dependent 7-cyano-7-deazaguanine reductase QueF